METRDEKETGGTDDGGRRGRNTTTHTAHSTLHCDVPKTTNTHLLNLAKLHNAPVLELCHLHRHTHNVGFSLSGSNSGPPHDRRVHITKRSVSGSVGCSLDHGATLGSPVLLYIGQLPCVHIFFLLTPTSVLGFFCSSFKGLTKEVS